MVKKSIKQMGYVEFMSYLGETNRPPGGKKMLRLLAQNSFLSTKSKVLHIGCNTGSSTMEIVRLTKCSAVGIDISKEMIAAAKTINKKDIYFKKIIFSTGNAENLIFKSSFFDLVFSAGSMAFVNNRYQAIREAVRVLKPWGFIADIVMYYDKKPPSKIIEEINSLMNIKIEPWELSFWQSLYLNHNLEDFYQYQEKIASRSIKEVYAYCDQMTEKIKNLRERKEARTKLKDIMLLFNENHKFVSSGLLIFRKRQFPEQVSLFGK